MIPKSDDHPVRLHDLVRIRGTNHDHPWHGAE